MYIPSYQIHNVLNVYRKQLSQGPGTARPDRPAPQHPPKDRINISSDAQRQSIMEKISSEIVDRIAQFDGDGQFVSKPEDDNSGRITRRNGDNGQNDTEFSYTVIDKHNRKITNTLPIQKLSPFGPSSGKADKPEIEDTFTLEKE